MAGNPLDQYRRAQQRSIQEATVPGQPYKAFEHASAPQRRLDLRPASKAQRIVSYAYIPEFIHAGGVILGFTVTMPRLSVNIQGRNLQPLIDLLREEKITQIQEFISGRYAEPQADQPIITKLQIVVSTTPAASMPPGHGKESERTQS